uniref:DUF721 domain-containing protein n=1 Tax=Candidatus Kentrum sp. TC TaxID=2126339 RepID=A0A450YCB7_9GAMM|nr:MAG: Protein of unknown function (DUF721) [Candidatus Kentron sp. TC]VFK40234.1 MAG: Protein of unknown function (DUF721) [Candidatus Kentron sp. TC]VFK54930.1 MAG: Protein of unknown function (DUF721) [Candidatus Kentron sp. TC]
MAKFATPSVKERLTHPGNPLYGLMIQAKLIEANGKALAERLGSPINHHCQLAQISADTVVLQVDSSVWYSKLRFLGPDIVTFFRTERRMPMITRVRIYVNPAALRHDEPGRRLQISSNVGNLLRNVAKTTQNEALRQAWLRLARNAP